MWADPADTMGSATGDCVFTAPTPSTRCMVAFVLAGGEDGGCPASCDYEPAHKPLCMVENITAGTCTDGCVSYPPEPLSR